MARLATLTSQQAKRHSLLQRLHRRGTGSRMHLARELGISNSRVCDLVEEMLDEGLLHEDATGDRRGRKGVNVRLNPRYGHFVGFDMEAKRLRLVLTDFTGKVAWETRLPMNPFNDREEFLKTLFGFIDDSMAEVRKRSKRLLGFGLAASGVIDTRRGIILHYDLIPVAANLPLRDMIAERVGLPTVMENNIRALTLAEWTAGAARKMNNFVCMSIRSGVGAGVVINGRLLPGTHGFAGETGYMVVTGGGSADEWKNLQQTVSEVALGIDVEASGFDLPESVIQRTGEIIGAQIASMAAVLDPEAFVLAGNVLKPDGPIWPHVLRTFKQVALSELAHRTQLLPGQLGRFAAAQGAAYRCLYDLFPVTPVIA